MADTRLPTLEPGRRTIASMESEPFRQSTGVRRVTAGAVATLAIGVAGVAWLMSQDERPAATGAATGPLPVIEEPRVAPEPAVIAVAAEPRVESPGEMQMCGGAWVKLKDDGDVDWDSVGAVTKDGVEALFASVTAAMASSADEQARGAALMISMPPLTLARAKASSCQGDVACEEDLALEAKRMAERRDALARLAQDSNDPTLYGWAVRACDFAPKESLGHCQLIDPAQWARLDPANAAPWMAVAARAQAEKDTTALSDALYRISAAERYDPEEYKLGLILMDHAPDAEANLWGTRNLVVRGVELGALQGFDAQTLPDLCSAKEMAADEARHDACERSAEMLVKGSASLKGLLIGRAIGKRVGWPEERNERLLKESAALQAAGTRQAAEGAASLGCAAIRAQVERVREFAAEGEVAALRRRVAEDSARTVATTTVHGFLPSVVPPR